MAFPEGNNPLAKGRKIWLSEKLPRLKRELQLRWDNRHNSSEKWFPDCNCPQAVASEALIEQWMNLAQSQLVGLEGIEIVPGRWESVPSVEKGTTPIVHYRDDIHIFCLHKDFGTVRQKLLEVGLTPLNWETLPDNWQFSDNEIRDWCLIHNWSPDPKSELNTEL